MKDVIDFLQGFDLRTIISLAIVVWYFTRNVRIEFHHRIDKIDQRIDKIDDRLTRIEGDMIEIKTVLRLKECCMITDDKQIKKVE